MRYCRNCAITTKEPDICKSCASAYKYMCKYREHFEETGKHILGNEPKWNPLGLKWPQKYIDEDSFRVQFLNNKFTYKGEVNYFPQSNIDEQEEKE